MRTELDRRTMLMTAAAGAAAVIADPVAVAANGTTYPTFLLDSITCGPNGCGSCRACASHAANKLFSTSASADVERAHPGCNCVIVDGPRLPQSVFSQLFLETTVVDRRNPNVAQLLAASTEQRAAAALPLPGGTLLIVGAGLTGWALATRRDRIAEVARVPRRHAGAATRGEVRRRG
jgi:hypothetical protein